MYYRAPDGDHLFLKYMEIVIQNVQLKVRRVILCGDWNINFIEDSVKLQELKHLMLLCNLVNGTS
jgi:exonuclease III